MKFPISLGVKPSDLPISITSLTISFSDLKAEAHNLIFSCNFVEGLLLSDSVTACNIHLVKNRVDNVVC